MNKEYLFIIHFRVSKHTDVIDPVKDLGEEKRSMYMIN